MNKTVYYFSGTGNSLYAAKFIAAKTGADIAHVSEFINCETAEAAGIVFPVYYGSLPPMVMDFAGKVRFNGSRYFFAVCTYGGGPGNSIRQLKKILKINGCKLSAAFGLHMPQNSFFKPWENKKNIYKKSVRELEHICKIINSNENHYSAKYLITFFFQLPITLLILAITKKFFIKLTGSSSKTDMRTLINISDKSFKAAQTCSGCGICARVCPSQNITINVILQWHGKCQNCLACYNWCPSKSIRTGIVKYGYFYRHPEITLEEFSRRQQREV